MSGETPITVVIVGGRLLFRLGMRQLMELDSRLRVVGLAENGRQAVEMVDRERPTVALIDLWMPDLEGIQTTAMIRRQYPETKVLILSDLASGGFATRALEAGAHGYLLKGTGPEAILSGIFAVVHGALVVAGAVADRVIDLIAHRMNEREMYDGLSARELQVLEMLAAGLAPTQVAHRLHIAEKTTRNHISHIYEKLGVHTRAQAVVYAASKGLAVPWPRLP